MKCENRLWRLRRSDTWAQRRIPSSYSLFLFFFVLSSSSTAQCRLFRSFPPLSYSFLVTVALCVCVCVSSATVTCVLCWQEVTSEVKSIMLPASSSRWQHWLIMESRCWHLDLKFSWNFANVIKAYVFFSHSESFNSAPRGVATNQGWDNMSNHRESNACFTQRLFLFCGSELCYFHLSQTKMDKVEILPSYHCCFGILILLYFDYICKDVFFLTIPDHNSVPDNRNWTSFFFCVQSHVKPDPYFKRI